MRVTCTVNGERARGRRRVGGREPALRAARAARPARLEERLRAGRVRLLHGLPRRHRRSAPAWSRPARPRAATWCTVEGLADGDRAATRCSRRSSRPAPCSAASARRACSSPCTTCWHASPQPSRPGDPRGARRQPVPVHRLREDPRRRPARRRARRARHERDRHRELRGRHGGRGRHRARDRARRRRRRPDRRGRRRARPRDVGGRRPRDRRHRLPGSPPAWSTPTTTSTSGPPAGWRSDAHALRVAHRRSTRSGPASTRRSCAPPPRAGLGWLALSGCTTTHRPPLRLPARRRRPARRRDRRGRRGRAAVPPDAAARWTSASRPGGLPPDSRRRGHRRGPRRHRGGDRPLPRPGAGLDAAGRGRAVLAVLGHRRADDARPPSWPGARACGCTPTSPRPSTRRTFCREQFGCTPVEYAERLGWLGDDVWLAHAVHLDDAAVARLGATGTGVAHCPSSNARLGAGIARVRDLLDAGVPVGLGVDGAASQRGRPARRGAAPGAAARPAARRPDRADRPRGAARSARSAAPGASAGTTSSARSRPGKLADLALWRLDGLGHAGIADPVAALVFGPPAAAGAAARRRPAGRRARRAAHRRRPASWPRRRGGRTAALMRKARPMTAPSTHTGPLVDGGVGTSPRRPDGTLKVTGEFAYSLRPVGRRHAVGRHAAQPAPVRPDPLGIDIAAALAAARRLRGAHRTTTCRAPSATAWSSPTSRCSPIDEVRYQGEPVALVAADHPETARRAAARIVVDYEVLTPVTDAEAALAPGAPRVHADADRCRRPAARGRRVARDGQSRPARAIRRGDPDAADVVVTGDYEVGMQDQAFLGPESGLAVPAEDGGVDLYVATQWLHVDQQQVAACLGPAAGEGAAARWPASAARSAAARTCRCRCTPACSRCTPASR